MWFKPNNPAASAALPRRSAGRPGWRWALPLLPAVLVFTVVASLVWLPWKAQNIESAERQEQLIADTLWVEQSVRLQLARDEESLQQVAADLGSGRLSAPEFRARLLPVLDSRRELVRVDWLDVNNRVLASTDEAAPVAVRRTEQQIATAESARRTGKARYAVPSRAADAQGQMRMEYDLPLLEYGRYKGSLVATYSTEAILEEMVPWWFAQDNEITLTGSDDNLIERLAAGGPGRGVYIHSHALDLPGANITLRTNSLKTAPKLLPNLLVGSVIALSLALLVSLFALWRDINRRLEVESALRQQVSFRTAMENSLVTGLRARDLAGRVTYVNPAFCQMVGTQADDLVGRLPPMPYWAPEAMAEYQKRFSEVLAGTITPQGFETIFQRASGKRFPVLIFESPLLDDTGRQTGWMGSILDISDRKQVEDLNRQQQEKLEASARLASMGEIASTLAHELNQPLAAISSYTTGALNMLTASLRSRSSKSLDTAGLQLALERASAQAQRAGQIIRSVHAFVKQREPARERVAVRALIDGIAPLIELQAHKYLVSLRLSVAPGLPPVLADRVLIEQVLLNLTRNAIESMERAAPEQRVLQVMVSRIEKAGEKAGENGDRSSDPGSSTDDHGVDSGTAAIRFAVIDRGHGIAPEIGERLFSPFFSTKAEGMGMGLNICRTAIEFHGGRLEYRDNPGGGTIFEFALPAAPARQTESRPTPA
ncbi:MAG: PAS domain S-box protein [Herminiimonas sp.]|nr:PAS domain S-box protein [Herminiimonas sp.]